MSKKKNFPSTTQPNSPQKLNPPPLDNSKSAMGAGSQKLRGNALWYALAAALAILVFVGYAGAFDNNFVDWDDYTYIIDNRDIAHPTWASLWAGWQKIVSLNYHPLTMSTLWLNAYVWGVKSAGSFIVVNVLLHVVNTILVFAIVRRLSNQNLWVSFFTAVLFGIHPAHVESVAWVSERKDVLYALFFLGGLWVYLQYLIPDKHHKYRLSRLVMAWLLFLLSCLSKAMAVVFPLVLLLLDYWHDRPLKEGRVWVEKIPFFALSLFFGLIAINIQSGSNFGGLFAQSFQYEKAVGDPAIYSFIEKCMIASYGLLMYIVKFFVPLHLCTYYPYPEQSVGGDLPVWFVGFFVGALAFVGLIIWSYLKKVKYLFWGLSFYVITLILVLQFISVGVVIMADRYTYLPYIGLSFVVLMGLDKWQQQRPKLQMPIIGALCLCTTILLYLCVQQVDTWQNTETLFGNVLKYYPKSDQVYGILGNYFGKNGKLDEAMINLEKAANLGSKRGEVYEGLGNAYGSKGQPDKAIPYYDKGIQFEPTKWGLYYNRGIAKMMLNKPAEAIPDFDKTLEIAPAKKREVLYSRGRAYVNSGKYQDGLNDLEALVAMGEQTAEVYLLRGIAKHGKGDLGGAAADYQKALQINPQLKEAQEKLKLIGGS